ncbi:hypothetical protein CYLTODRAFT_421625 [Cylindrobasidium torrendii FP15055 ss-10]|uniref:F-box domain-containing protein n=1 Tax=Cylindrobasidium torrendii FP15055 ss-10 TaxID=1314674 RepID=A0A0D7BD32_9AGAR|nr:hypothetical protein CYLTODRAFT_421625 [Cylindrobasidium torrendii FP15055 ss-10]
MLDIPLEIKLAIIDDLAETDILDPFSGIALVWPEVMFRIRELRFSNIHLDTTRKVRLLAEALEGLLSLCPIIHTANITSSLFSRHPDSVYDSPDLSRLFRLFKELNTIMIRGIKPLSQPQTVAAFHCLPSTITKVDLHMSSEYHDSATDAWCKAFELLSAFPFVECLGLEYTCHSSITMGEDAITQIVAKPFPFLRTLSLGSSLLKPMEKLIERGLSPNLESLTIEDMIWDHGLVKAFNGLLHCWSDTLQELRIPYPGAVANSAGSLTFFLPPNLDVLEFRITFVASQPGMPDFDDDRYTDFLIRTLEQRCRSGATLRSLVVTMSFSWQKIRKADAAETERFHLLDALLGSRELHVMHLDWHSICGDRLEDIDNDEPPSRETVTQWVYENMFPATCARFLTEDGRHTFGTTATLKSMCW